MKTIIQEGKSARGRGNQELLTAGRKLATWVATLLVTSASWLSSQATPVVHGISAANISVQQNDTSNNAISVTLTTPVEINDFRVINNTQTSRADYFVQIGASATDDVTNGILISSISDNGRDNGEGNGTNWGTSAIDSGATATPGSSGQWWIPVFGTMDDTNYPEYNFDVSAAYFPFANGWYGGWVVNATGANNGVSATLSSDRFLGNTNMVLGTHVIPLGGGKVTVDLRAFNLDSRSNAIMLACGGKNEENFANSQPNADGTWLVTCRDDASGGGEADPVAFVCVPITNHLIVSGRFMGDGSIAMQSAPFHVTTTVGGIYHLTIPGYLPGQGVLVISGEEGGSVNGDNIVSYQATADGWNIQTRDVGAGNARPNLQALPAGDGVASFVFIPAPTAGVMITPTNGLATTENGGAASFTVVLDAPPSDEVDINLSSSQPTAGTPSVSSLAFLPGNWNIPQTVTVTGLDNSSSVVQPYNIDFSPATSTDTNYNGLQAPSVSLVNVPNGQPGIFVVPTNGLVTSGAGLTATFEVLVNVQPTSDVTLGFSSSDLTQGTASPSSVTINSGNWTTPQTVTITGVDDNTVDGDIAYQIIGAAAVSSDPNYSGRAVGNVSVVNLETDAAGVIFNVTGALPVSEGGTTNFTVALAEKPLADVVLNFASDDTTDGTVSPSSRTFTPGNWNMPQSVTLTGLNNPAINANPIYNITTMVNSTALGYSNLVVSNLVATTVKAVGLPTGTTIYGLGMPPIGIDGLATVNQALDFGGATLTIALTANGDAGDALAIRNDGTATGQIGVSGNTVSYEGGSIGTFTGGGGTTPLVVTMQSGVAATAVQGLLEAVTFGATSTSNLNSRTVQVTLNFASSGMSTVSKNIRVGKLRLTQYQDGADYGYGVYSNEADIEISQTAPGTPYPAGSNPANGLFVALNSSSSDHQVLLRFDNLIGSGSNQIPPGAIIVSADLNLNLVNSGDGFAMNRMLISWDENNSTWGSFSDQFGNSGIGVVADDSTSRSNSFSQLGMFTESPGPNDSTIYNTTTTGTGNVTIGVTPDVQAWADGDTNYGWVCDPLGVLDAAGNQPWNNLTDGTGFSPSEDATMANRPRLRVYWLPAGTMGTSFRYGVNGYTDASDCEILQATPTANTSAGAEVFSDANDLGLSNNSQCLIQFSNIVGNGASQVPPNAHIEVAMLNLASLNSAAAVGDGGRFFALLEPWQASTTTWNSWGGTGIQNDGAKAAINPTVTAGSPSLAPNVQGGYHSFEVTPDVQNWASGNLPNYGWAILPWVGGSDGWGIDTSESATEASRPQLVVYYSPGTAAPARPTLLPLMVSASQVTVKFTGTIGATYSVWRSAAVNTGYALQGTSMVDGGGTGTFLDNAPLSTKAFYRVSYP